MSGVIIGQIILWLIVTIIAIVVIVYLLSWLYHRSTKEIAFVRTGFGGEKVVINGGALVLPIIHEITPVNLNVLRIPVSRTKADAIITRDRMRVDIEAEFFVRVIQKKEAVGAAASTLGRRTMEQGQVAELLSGKFIGALRSVASGMSLDEMHENLPDLVLRVEECAVGTLAENGLELETVAITDLDQTDLEYFNPSNRFDAEGMTQLIEAIEARRKLRNDIEQSSMVAIRGRNLEAEKETLNLEQESQSLRLNQEQAIEVMRSSQRANVQKTRAASDTEAEQSRIASEQETREREIKRQRILEASEIKAREEIEKSRILQEKNLEQARIDRDQIIREEQIKQKHTLDHTEIVANEDTERSKIISEQQLRMSRIMTEEESETKDILRQQQIETTRINADKSVETSRIEQEKILEKARIERNKVLRNQQIAERKLIEESEISAQEEIETARIVSNRVLDKARIQQERDKEKLEIERNQLLELSEIERQISILQKKAEEAETRSSTELARAKAVEAEEKVKTVREKVVAERVAEVDKVIAEKDAKIAKISAEAEKVTATISADVKRLNNEAENVLSEEARSSMLRSKLIDRMEGIVRESVKPMEKIEGIKIIHVEGLGGSGDTSSSPTDEVIQSALRYRVQAPLIDEMLKEIGVTNPNVSGMDDIFRSAKDIQSISKVSNADKEDKQDD